MLHLRGKEDGAFFIYKVNILSLFSQCRGIGLGRGYIQYNLLHHPLNHLNNPPKSSEDYA
ncbi:hypothetical protein Slin_4401 [Spirosoma linguale DSM 74]|uniref:Uncharacterized protein n=1 Tax=Spirosoma linguale (strain ATCC 33905 / DSM 74 / LMG 10896 / Claus 1) TaxID=504472 RepID=D2QLU2_SPILD|nr:hypothetical protein Slin_4401 [Spirosoma linguale DSM 74]